MKFASLSAILVLCLFAGFGFGLNEEPKCDNPTSCPECIKDLSPELKRKACEDYEFVAILKINRENGKSCNSFEVVEVIKGRFDGNSKKYALGQHCPQCEYIKENKVLVIVKKESFTNNIFVFDKTTILVDASKVDELPCRQKVQNEEAKIDKPEHEKRGTEGNSNQYNQVPSQNYQPAPSYNPGHQGYPMMPPHMPPMHPYGPPMYGPRPPPGPMYNPGYGGPAGYTPPPNSYNEVYEEPRYDTPKYGKPENSYEPPKQGSYDSNYNPPTYNPPNPYPPMNPPKYGGSDYNSGSSYNDYEKPAPKYESNYGSNYNPPNPPSYGSNYNPPNYGSNYNPPNYGSNYNPPNPPSYGSDYNPPSYSSDYNPPSYGSNYNPPSYDSNYNPPTYGSNYNPPTYGSNYNPPSPPSYGSNYNPPSYGSNYNPPSPPSYNPPNPPSYGSSYNPPSPASYGSSYNPPSYGNSYNPPSPNYGNEYEAYKPSQPSYPTPSYNREPKYEEPKSPYDNYGYTPPSSYSPNYEKNSYAKQEYPSTPMHNSNTYYHRKGYATPLQPYQHYFPETQNEYQQIHGYRKPIGYLTTHHLKAHESYTNGRTNPGQYLLSHTSTHHGHHYVPPFQYNPQPYIPYPPMKHGKKVIVPVNSYYASSTANEAPVSLPATCSEVSDKCPLSLTEINEDLMANTCSFKNIILVEIEEQPKKSSNSSYFGVLRVKSVYRNSTEVPSTIEFTELESCNVLQSSESGSQVILFTKKDSGLNCLPLSDSVYSVLFSPTNEYDTKRSANKCSNK